MPRFLDLDDAKQNPDWQIVFQGGNRINAGDAATILEESPWETAYGLWLLKTKRKPRPIQTAAMAHGNTTEPLIFEWYHNEKKIAGTSQAWALYDDADYIQAKCDFWNSDLRHGAEFKAPVHGDTTHRQAKEGQIPYHYYLQCLHEMEVCDSQTWDYVSWFQGDGVIIPVERNTEFWLTEMVPRYQEFYRRVAENAWPKPEGQAVEESEEWSQAARLFLDGKVMEGDSKERKKRGEAMLRRMAIAKVTTGAGIRASWVAYKPRWEAKVTAESEQALAAIMKALAPLEGKQGVGKISSTAWPPNLVLRVSEQDDAN